MQVNEPIELRGELADLDHEIRMLEQLFGKTVHDFDFAIGD